MNSLSAIEAVRVRAVLEDALEKLSFLSIVTPDVMGHRDEMSALVGDEISQTIKAQREMEAKYDALVQQAASLKGHTNKAKLREVQAQLRAVSTELRDSMRGLCRSLKENPDVGDNLAKLAEERDEVVRLLDTTYRELEDGHYYHTLAEQVRQQAEARDRVAAVSQKEESTTKEVGVLSATLKEEEDKHMVESEGKKAEIAALKDKLRKLKQDTTATIRYARKEIVSKTEANGKLYTAEEREIAATIESIKARMAIEAEAHEASMELLKREQEELTRQAEGWKARHAAEVASKAAELKALTAERDAQAALLIKLQARYEKDLQVMAEREAEAERVAMEKAMNAARAEAEQKAAASLVKIMGPMWMAVLGARQMAAEEKSKGKGKKK